MATQSKSPFRTISDANKEYYISINGEERGPYLITDLQKLYRNKHISPFDKVRVSDGGESIDLLKMIEIDEQPESKFAHQAPNQYRPNHPQVVYQQTEISNNVLAAIVNIFLPGVGQMIQGRIGAGIAFFFATIIGYLIFVIPGLILHIVSIVDAANYSPPSKRFRH